MIDLSQQRISKITPGWPLTIHTDAGWVITVECKILYAAGSGTTQVFIGDELATAEMLALALTGRAIHSVAITATEGLTMILTPYAEVTLPPDEDFEAWNVAGPEGERVVSMPGGELAYWNPGKP